MSAGGLIHFQMLTRPFHSSSEQHRMLIPLISLSLRVISEGGDLSEAGSLIQLLATSENTAPLFMIPQSRHNGLKGSEASVWSHTLFSVLRERFDCLSVKKATVKAMGETEGTGACLLSNFAAFIQAVKSNNQEIMQPRFCILQTCQEKH